LRILRRIEVSDGDAKSEWIWASYIKAYLLRNKKNMEETIMSGLNRESSDQAYNLGRLFLVFEQLQQSSSESQLNTTIKNRYFASASATPALVFPALFRLSDAHLNSAKMKKNPNRIVYFNKFITEIVSRLGESFPATLNTEEQGKFYLGYYQQKQDFFKKKEKNQQNDEKNSSNDLEVSEGE